jgi:predicted glycoside hydrolase/deacetylase ChbG (UPF0249 family)
VSGPRLIVNADDFGVTRGVSRGILDASRDGIVTSTTVMVNLEPQDDLDEEARALDSLALGLHVNLTWGAPVSGPAAVPSLVGPDGRLVRDVRAAAARATAEDVRRETEAQIERFTRRFGRPPTHLDSHHHAHRQPGIMDAVLDVVVSAGLPLRSQDPGFREGLRRHGVATPDHFLGGDDPAPFWTVERLLDALASLPLGITELMCHPGRYDETLAYSRYGRERETELAALLHPEARATIERLGIELASFSAVAPA